VQADLFQIRFSYRVHSRSQKELGKSRISAGVAERGCFWKGKREPTNFSAEDGKFITAKETPWKDKGKPKVQLMDPNGQKKISIWPYRQKKV